MSDEDAPPTPVWEGAYDEDGLPHGQVCPVSAAVQSLNTNHDKCEGPCSGNYEVPSASPRGR
ncbi:hypothetical protein HaLaN_20612, partial [Haematococcus lacustris]